MLKQEKPSIGDLKIGKVDGKEEFFLDGVDDPDFKDSFLMPDNVRYSDFLEREMYFITGFRGTGKTSLLRYLISQMQGKEKYRSIALFKSDLPEEKRMSISSHSGAVLSEYDPQKMGISQDFKSAWLWFLLDHIGKIIRDAPECALDDEAKERFLKIMGLSVASPYKKVLGFLPKLAGAKIKIGADIPFFEGAVDLEFESDRSTSATALFTEVVDAASEALMQVTIKEKIVIGVDELEVFFISSEQYSRDLAMVRDLIFAVDRLNQKLRSKRKDVFILAAIRREVVNAIGPLGQEINRVVHDRGVSLSWHHAQRSLEHPLIEIIRRKIRKSLPGNYNGDPIQEYFDQTINGEPLDAYILDRSFYRPRDIMWRLTFAQKLFPAHARFDAFVLGETESEYSAQLWSEVEYELSASLAPEEISAVTSIFSGIKRVFFLSDLEEIAKTKAKYSKNVESFIVSHSLADVCEMLYSHGALGNDFRTGSTGSVSRNRWVYRGDVNLIVDQRMTLNSSIRKALSAIDQRKRGSAGKGHRR
ncbi:P-loop ATPase, Sll1717 family [Agrobacterium cavarae]